LLGDARLKKLDDIHAIQSSTVVRPARRLTEPHPRFVDGGLDGSDLALGAGTVGSSAAARGGRMLFILVLQ
jgi:hypothetical protein